MSNPKPPSASALPTEPPELAAERDRLLPELEKQAKAATGSTQAMLRKLHEVLVHTKPGVPVDFQLYADAKVAFERFMKEPVLPVPPITLQVIEFMQKRAVAMGWTGQMKLPKGAPPPPPGLITPVTPPTASATGSIPPRSGPKPGDTLPPRSAPKPGDTLPPRTGPSDGFEGLGKASGSVALNPKGGEPVPASKSKPDLQSDARLKTPGGGNLKG